MGVVYVPGAVQEKLEPMIIMLTKYYINAKTIIVL